MKPNKLPSGSWRIVVSLGTDENGKRIYKSITRKSRQECIAEAHRVAGHAQKIKEDESYMTLGEAIDSYIEMKSNLLSPATIRGYTAIRNNHLQPEMDSCLKNLSQNIIQAAINREAGKYSPKTVKNIYGLLTAIFKRFAKRKLEIDLPQPVPHQINLLTDEQLKTLISLLNGKSYELPVLMAMFLGLRRSEILALEYSDYDRATKTLNITKAKVPDKDGNYVIKPPKTVGSNRQLAVPEYLAEKIEACIDRGDSFYPISPSRVSINLGNLCDKNGLPRIGLHDLRHQNASIMLSLGISDKYAMERGGWTTNDTMKNIYQHTLSAGRIEADQKMNDYFDKLSKG